MLKIKERILAKARSERIEAYVLSKALRKEECTDAHIKEVYHMSDSEFAAAADILIKDGKVVSI